MPRGKYPASPALLAAAVYNILWGISVVAAPGWFFAFARMEAPAYPQIWQCVGMIVGVYGVGYAIAAKDPVRHWPIVFVGLLGKILGPIGFLFAAAEGAFSWRAGAVLLANDLIWWAPFSALLWRALRERASRAAPAAPPTRSEALGDFAVRGRSLAEASKEKPLLVVFLRHFGCTFCQEALGDLLLTRPRLEPTHQIVLVHTGTEGEAQRVLEQGGLADLPRIADPEGRLYAAFGLGKGSFPQLFGWRNWVRGVAAALRGHLPARIRGDAFQMPGVAVVENGEAIGVHRHRSASERPDYIGLARGAIPA